MGKRQRRRLRERGEHKQPNESRADFEVRTVLKKKVK